MSAAAAAGHLVRHFSNFTKLLRSVLHTACCKIGHGATVLLQLQWQQILPHILVASGQVVCSLSTRIFLGNGYAVFDQKAGGRHTTSAGCKVQTRFASVGDASQVNTARKQILYHLHVVRPAASHVQHVFIVRCSDMT